MTAGESFVATGAPGTGGIASRSHQQACDRLRRGTGTLARLLLDDARGCRAAPDLERSDDCGNAEVVVLGLERHVLLLI